MHSDESGPIKRTQNQRKNDYTVILFKNSTAPRNAPYYLEMFKPYKLPIFTLQRSMHCLCTPFPFSSSNLSFLQLKIALTICCRKVGVVRPKNGGQTNFTFVRFSATSRLNGEYPMNETRQTIGQGR